MSTSLQTVLEELPSTDWRRRPLLDFIKGLDKNGFVTSYGPRCIGTTLYAEDLLMLADHIARAHTRAHGGGR